MATETHTPGDLIIGDYPIATRTETIAAGQTLDRGAVLALNGSDELILSVGSANDGTEIPHAILAVDVDTTGGALDAPTYHSGRFDDSKLTFGAGHTAETVEAGFAKSGRPIFLKTLK